MDKRNIEYYNLSEEKEKRMWSNCTFVFDTSSLLEFYYFSKKQQEEIFNNVFGKIQGRLWIPNHVEYEYLKNRESTSKKPIEEKYKTLDSDHLKVMRETIVKLRNNVRDFSQKTKRNGNHPFINSKISSNFESICEKFQQDFIDFENEVKHEIAEREKQINRIAEKDTVLEGLSKYFKVGESYPFKDMMEIVIEGEIRYKSKIPPGYEDGTGSNSKEGIQKFGDLIIWKQIIQYAKTSNKPIILITNDVKDDWCYKYKRGNEVRIEKPREDLLREIKDEAGVEFWMYTLSQFLYQANNLLNANVDEEIIEESKAMTVKADEIKIGVNLLKSYHLIYMSIYDRDDEKAFNEFAERMRDRFQNILIKVWVVEEYMDHLTVRITSGYLETEKLVEFANEINQSKIGVYISKVIRDDR